MTKVSSSAGHERDVTWSAAPVPRPAVILLLTLLMTALAGCDRSGALPDAHAESELPLELATAAEDEEAGMLVLEPLRVAIPDFEGAPVLATSEHSRQDDAFALEEPWIARGHLAGSDWHFIELRTGDEAQLWYIEAAGEDLARLELQNAIGRRLAARNVERGAAIMANLHLLPGSHWFSIRAGSGGAEYTFRAVPLGPPRSHSELEPNDDPGRAHRMAFGLPRSGHLFPAGDIDVYRFTVSAAEHVVLTLEPPADLRVRMEVLASYGGEQSHSIATGDSREPGDTLRYPTILDPGDYLVRVSAADRGARSVNPYVLRLDRRDPFIRPPDLEPTDLNRARSLPSDLILYGSLGQFGRTSWYEMPVVDSATLVSVEVGLAPDDLGLTLYDAESGRIAERFRADRESSGLSATLPPGAPYRLQVSGTSDFRVGLSFDPHPELHAPGPGLAVELEIERGDAVAAYWPYAQRIEVPVRLKNRGGEPTELSLGASSTDRTWVPVLPAEPVSLEAGAETTVEMAVEVGPDAWALDPVVINVRARDGTGQTTMAAQRFWPRCGALPANPHPVTPLPPALTGGLNLASPLFGGEPFAASERDRTGKAPLFDSRLYGGWSISARNLPAEVTVRLAGGAVPTISGVILYPVRGRRPDYQLKDFEVLVSTDGQVFRKALAGTLERGRAEQAFAFDEPVRARFARLRMKTNHADNMAAGHLFLGEWKAVAAPHEDPPGMGPWNLAAAELGGFVPWSEPIQPHDASAMLSKDGRRQTVHLNEGESVRWVVGFNQNRAAQVRELRLTEWPEDERAGRLGDLMVAVSTESPVGPWTELGLWERRDMNGTASTFSLDAPVWARFILFVGADSDEAGRRTLPRSLEVLERPVDGEYRSILGEWGHGSRQAAFEALTSGQVRPFIAATGANHSRETALRLRGGETRASSVQPGHGVDWYRIDVPGSHDNLIIRIRGEPYLRVHGSLEGHRGEPVATDQDDLTPQERVLRANVRPGATYYLAVRGDAPPVVSFWSDRGTLRTFWATVEQAQQQLGGGEQRRAPVRYDPEADDQDSWVVTSSSGMTEGMLRTLRGLDASPALLLLADGDAAFDWSADLWRATEELRPQVFAVRFSSNQHPAHDEPLMPSWTTVSGGHYAVVGTKSEADAAVDRALCYLRGSAQYTVEIVTSREEAPEPELYERLVDAGRVVARGILFDFDRHTLRSESYPVLRQIGEMLQERPELRLLIEGHTDNVGSRQYNQGLSERRAASVRAYLIERYAIDSDRLQSVGRGETMPADTNETDEGRQQNRRVELVRLQT